MEIVDSNDTQIFQPVEKNNDLRFGEVFPDKKLERHEISDRDWAILALIQTVVKEKGLVWIGVITKRTSTPPILVYSTLKRLWQAGIVRRFYKLRFRISIVQPAKNQVWYVINDPESYVAPEIVRPPSRRGMNWKLKTQIPDHVVAEIRRCSPEVTTEAIAQKYDISISHADYLRNYGLRQEILP